MSRETISLPPGDDFDAWADYYFNECKVYFTRDTDGLANMDKWKWTVFINPPYNRKGTVERWINASIQYNRHPAPFDSMLLVIGSSCYCQSYINNRQI